MSSPLYDLWDLTPETYAHRAEIRKRHAAYRRRMTHKYNRLYLLLFLIAVVAVGMLADIAHGWIG